MASRIRRTVSVDTNRPRCAGVLCHVHGNLRGIVTVLTLLDRLLLRTQRGGAQIEIDIDAGVRAEVHRTLLVLATVRLLFRVGGG